MKPTARILVLCYITMASSYAASNHALVIDAGSTGSRLRIYKVEAVADGGIPKVVDIGKNEKGLKIKDRPLHDVSLHYDAVQAYLEPLLQAGQHFLIKQEGLNADQLGRVPIYLRATGGVRMMQDATQRQTLMDLSSEVLALSEFLSRGAKPITGEEEAFYDWVVVNDLEGTLGTDATFGAAENGGQSTQLAFEMDRSTDDPQLAPYIHRLRFGSKEHIVYAKGYDNLGQESVRKICKKDPNGICEQVCALNGGTGDYKACRQYFHGYLNANSERRDEVGLMDAYQPKLRGDFRGLCNFANIEAETGASPFNSQTLDAMGEELCKKPIHELKTMNQFGGLKEQFRSDYCFTGAFMSVFLSGDAGSDRTDGFGFDRNSVSFDPVLTINGEEPNWTKGFIILEAQNGAFE